LGIIADREALESYHRGYRSLNLVLSTLEHSLKHTDPKHLVDKAVEVKGSALVIRSSLQNLSLRMNLSDFDSIYAVGAGKATSNMAEALCSILGWRISGGAINVPYMSNIRINNDKVCAYT
jgi:glycerate-2-kinase